MIRYKRSFYVTIIWGYTNLFKDMWISAFYPKTQKQDNIAFRCGIIHAAAAFAAALQSISSATEIPLNSSCRYPAYARTRPACRYLAFELHMLSDAKAGKIDIILTKSVSRFARNTTDALTAIQDLHDCGVAIHFDEEKLQTDNASHRIIITTYEAVAEAENENRSRSVRWGIKQKARNGTSTLFDRKCYGYMNGETGALEIDPEQAPVVEMIFKLYLQGSSILGIIKELERHGIKSPTGKDRWCKHTIEVMLSNEKYYGDVVIFKSYNDGYPKKRRIQNNAGIREKLIAEHDHAAIISRETYNAVQAEKARRSNVIQDGSGVQRKDTRYSSKKGNLSENK